MIGPTDILIITGMDITRTDMVTGAHIFGELEQPQQVRSSSQR